MIEWNELLSELSAGRVVPVIGNDLSLIKDDDSVITLNRFILRKLRERYLRITTQENLSELILYEPEIKQAIREIYDSLSEDQIELSLLIELSKVPEFSFFISVTIDDLLIKALCKERKLEKSQIRVINYSIAQSPSQISWGEQPRITVFKLLGSLAQGYPAMNEEEMLEYFFSLAVNQQDEIIETFFNLVEDKRLLFIGCDFSDWFMRFIIRIISNKRYRDHQIKHFVVWDGRSLDQKLYSFLEYFQEYLYPPIEDHYKGVRTFIEKLHEKKKLDENVPLKYIGLVFISYYNKDKDIAKQLKAFLRKKGIDIWFDEDHFHSGKVTDVIISKIRECNVFIALLSNNILSEPACYAVKTEWPAMRERLNYDRQQTQKNTFLPFPIIADNTDFKDQRIPEYIRDYHMECFPTGQNLILQEILKYLVPVESVSPKYNE